MRYQHTWEEVEREGREYTIEFDIDYDVTPFRPAKVDCDPDDGHPAEGGEVIINDIKVLSVKPVDVGMVILTVSEKLYWTERFVEQIDEDFEHELRDHAATYEEAAREEAEEARQEHLREDRYSDSYGEE